MHFIKLLALTKIFGLISPIKRAHNKNIISLVNSLGQLLTGWRFAQYSQQVIAPYVKRYIFREAR
jgi:hypothetical protein